MKLVAALVLMMAIGLSGVYSQPIDDDAVSADDFLEIDGEIVDMDDALHKYRMLKVLSRIIAEEEAKDLLNPKKRFIADTFKKIKDAIVGAFKKIPFGGGDVDPVRDDLWNKIKAALSKIKDKLPMTSSDKFVNEVIPYINSDMTVGACVTTITPHATAILGIFDSLMGAVAKPLCEAALAKLEEFAG